MFRGQIGPHLCTPETELHMPPALPPQRRSWPKMKPKTLSCTQVRALASEWRVVCGRTAAVRGDTRHSGRHERGRSALAAVATGMAAAAWQHRLAARAGRGARAAAGGLLPPTPQGVHLLLQPVTPRPAGDNRLVRFWAAMDCQDLIASKIVRVMLLGLQRDTATDSRRDQPCEETSRCQLDLRPVARKILVCVGLQHCFVWRSIPTQIPLLQQARTCAAGPATWRPAEPRWCAPPAAPHLRHRLGHVPQPLPRSPPRAAPARGRKDHGCVISVQTFRHSGIVSDQFCSDLRRGPPSLSPGDGGAGTSEQTNPAAPITVLRWMLTVGTHTHSRQNSALLQVRMVHPAAAAPGRTCSATLTASTMEE